MFKKHFSPLALTSALCLFSPAAAKANLLTQATASVDCVNYHLKIHAIDLSPGTDYTINYNFTATVADVPTSIAGTIDFTATADAVTESASGTWNLTSNFTAVTGLATLTSTGFTVPIIINTSTNENGAAVLNCAPGSWSQQGGKLVGTGAVRGRDVAVEQGNSVSVSAGGNTVIVGGFGDNNGVGAAWVFIRSNGIWRQQGPKLIGSDAVGAAEQGYSVALSADGNTAIVGGPVDNISRSGFAIGAAWVFTRAHGIWRQQGSKLVGTGAINLPEQGWSVSLSADGNTAIVGGPNDGANGAAWVFSRSGGIWKQYGSKLVGTGAVGNASQGASVSLSADGRTAMIGGPTDNLLGNASAGAAWVFTGANGVWKQQGSKLVGTEAVGIAFQGTSVSLSGDGNTAALGGPRDDKAGATWVFTRSVGAWSQQGSKLVGTRTKGFAAQGVSVSLSGDGNTVLIGGFGNDDGLGAAWAFTRTGGVWREQGPKLIGTGTVGDALLGASVSVSGDGSTAVVGGPGDGRVGAAWIFTKLVPEFSGIAGKSNCYSNGTEALIRQFHGLNVAATALGYNNVPAMLHGLLEFCRE